MRTVIALCAVVPAFAACLAPALDAADSASGLSGDLPVLLPDMEWFAASYREGVGFHSNEEIAARIDRIAAARPDLARIETIGASRGEREIRALVLTNESVGGTKLAPFFDGGHHGNENEGIESTLLLAEYLLANNDRNSTVRDMLARFEIWIVPVVNMDGNAAQTRGNAMGVNLNRNYDVDWANPLGGTSPPMSLAARVTGQPMTSVGGPFGEHPGTEPFSEPEAQAIRDVLSSLDTRLAFYASHHTAVPALLVPWAAFEPPFPVPANERAVFDSLVDWARAETIFRAGGSSWGNVESGLYYSASGTSQDWAYATHRVPAFTIEVAGCGQNAVLDPRWGPDNVECGTIGDGSDLAYWVQAALEVQMKLLSNAEVLHRWEEPASLPLLPEGVPPEGPYT